MGGSRLWFLVIETIILLKHKGSRASQVALVKNLHAYAGDLRHVVSQVLGWGDPLEEGMAIHSSIIAGRTPWTEEPGRL